MDFGSAILTINWLSVILAALSAFVIGSLWYSPILFGKAWQEEIKLSDSDIKNANMPLIFGSSFVLNLIAAIVLAVFIGKGATAGFGAIAGFLIGIAWIATSLGINYLFARKSLKLYLIDAGYFVLFFPVMGLILGAF
jgi:hypothetical protein